MTRNRTPTADALHAIARALSHPTPPDTRPTPALAAEDRRVIAAWQLELEHLGRWILIPPAGRIYEDRDEKADSVRTIGGRLVGLRATPPSNDPRPASQPLTPERILVIQQGGHIGELPVAIDQTVHVAPRSWS